MKSGEKIGRDPRAMTTAELNALGHTANSVLRAVRRNCIDCSGGSETEVRKCVTTQCPLWPFRMGSNPLNRREVSEEQRGAMRSRLAAARATRAAVPA